MKYFSVLSQAVYDIATLIKGHKNKIWFSQKQKVTGRGRPWQPEGGKKMVTEKISPLKAQQRLWVYKCQFSRSSGNSRTQAKTAQDNRGANRSHCQSSKKSKSCRDGKIYRETWQETPSATVSKTKGNQRMAWAALYGLGGYAPPSNKGAIPQTIMWMSLSRVEQYTVCMWQLQSSIIPASLCPQRI